MAVPTTVVLQRGLMKVQVPLGESLMGCIDTHEVFNVSIAYRPYATKEEQVSAFGLPAAEAPPAQVGTWVGSVDAGSSVNSPRLSLCCHGNGTHTECAAHVLPGRLTLEDAGAFSLPTLLPCLLISMTPEALATSGDSYPPGQPDDQVISLRRIKEAINDIPNYLIPQLQGECWALAVRTLPNDVGARRIAKYEGTNGPYPTPAAMGWLASLGASYSRCATGEGTVGGPSAKAELGKGGLLHLLLDLPSADREDDQGLLLSHRAFWGLPPRGQDGEIPLLLPPRTITEFCVFPPVCAAPDGLYVLDLQLSPIVLEATPSRPLLYPITTLHTDK